MTIIHPMQLTEHFQLSEFTRSTTATRLGIDNTPSEQVIDNLRQLCIHVLEPLRQTVTLPIIISSGYRSPPLNKAVGGVRNSQHMTGQACDIYQPDKKKRHEWFLILMDGDFDQLIMEHNAKGSTWIHVSYNSTPSLNRHQVLRLTKKEK